MKRNVCEKRAEMGNEKKRKERELELNDSSTRHQCSLNLRTKLCLVSGAANVSFSF